MDPDTLLPLFAKEFPELIVEVKKVKDPEPRSRGVKRCSGCGTALTYDYRPFNETFLDLTWCAMCAGYCPGTPGIREPKLGETWENVYGDRVRMIEEYTEGPYGGLATGVTTDGSHRGMRRSNVEQGKWFFFTGPESTVNDILLGNI